ncbi:MAG TPA: hypothetical protein VER08_02620 [Pyrinomonadaceae bacterium]|nr:hypothetical protein [Pyrinomonadaceae bacterium]
MATAAVNIGPRERRKRRLMGIVALAAGAGLAFVLVVFGAPRLMRLLLFVPFWLAGLGLFQAKEATCIALAGRDACNMDEGEETISDPARREALRAKAQRIHRRAFILAVVATLVALVFPTL